MKKLIVLPLLTILIGTFIAYGQEQEDKPQTTLGYSTSDDVLRGSWNRFTNQTTALGVANKMLMYARAESSNGVNIDTFTIGVPLYRIGNVGYVSLLFHVDTATAVGIVPKHKLIVLGHVRDNTDVFSTTNITIWNYTANDADTILVIDSLNSSILQVGTVAETTLSIRMYDSITGIWQTDSTGSNDTTRTQYIMGGFLIQ